MSGRCGLAAKITVIAAVLGAGCATAGWTGTGWTGAGNRPATATSSPAEDRLNAVAALGGSDAWAVGTRYLSSHDGGFLTLTEHWDGQSWKVVPSPSPAGIGEQTASILAAVAIDAPDDAWAVGSQSPASTDPGSTPPHGLIEHWNGTSWTVVPGPRSGGHITNLTDVAAVSPAAAWAIGHGTASGHVYTVFMRWNGTRWRYLPSPAGRDLSGLAVISAHDIWVVGTKAPTKAAPTDRTLAEHWDGSKWTVAPTPNAFKGRTTDSSLHAVAGSSSSNLWAVGWYRSGHVGMDGTLVEHWDGTRWQLQPSPDGTGSTGLSQLFAVDALSRTSALAVGSYAVRSVLPLNERWDGAHWTTVPTKLRPGVHGTLLSGVAQVNPHYAWAVGGALNQNDRPITFMEKWDGTGWQQVPTPNP